MKKLRRVHTVNRRARQAEQRQVRVRQDKRLKDSHVKED